jgi:hypothetical protein
VACDAFTCDQSDNLLLTARFLAARGAEFVVVGGCALRLHGLDHQPPDLDVVPEPSLENLRRLFDSLSELGTVGRERRPTDHALMTREILTRRSPVGSVDVMLLRGREDYASLTRDGSSISLKGRVLRVAAIGDVLRMRARFGKVPVGG